MTCSDIGDIGDRWERRQEYSQDLFDLYYRILSAGQFSLNTDIFCDLYIIVIF